GRFGLGRCRYRARGLFRVCSPTVWRDRRTCRRWRSGEIARLPKNMLPPRRSLPSLRVQRRAVIRKCSSEKYSVSARLWGARGSGWLGFPELRHRRFSFYWARRGGPTDGAIDCVEGGACGAFDTHALQLHAAKVDAARIRLELEKIGTAVKCGACFVFRFQSLAVLSEKTRGIVRSFEREMEHQRRVFCLRVLEDGVTVAIPCR